MPARQLHDPVYAEDELLPLSGLQHYVFCERQCALIHLEQIWVDNVLTAEGAILHERADTPGVETRADLVTARGVPLRSLRLGLAGRADVVEYRRLGARVAIGSENVAAGIELRGREGLWAPVPVEYKRGASKFSNCDRVQLCAQALSLEEMHGVSISRAELYYAQPRRRTEVSLDAQLRRLTEDVALAYHELIEAGTTPMVAYQPKCRNCSLLELCNPPRRGRPSSAAAYTHREVLRTLAEPTCADT